MNTSFVFFADGFEEVEALTTVDIMRRAGMEVITVSINPSLEVRGAHGARPATRHEEREARPPDDVLRELRVPSPRRDEKDRRAV